MMDPAAWSQLGVGVAALLALVYVIREIRKLFNVVLTFVGNHMSSVTAAQEMTAKAMQDVAVSLQGMKDSADRLHDDNLETAAVLRAADAKVRRLVDTIEPPKPPRRRASAPATK